MKITASSSEARSTTLAMRSFAGLLVIGLLFGACGAAAQATAPSSAIAEPVAPTTAPAAAPIATPAPASTETPTVPPTTAPTIAPTAAPTVARTAAPTAKPAATVAPTVAPTAVATRAPTIAPPTPTVARPAFIMPDDPQAVGYLTKATGYGLVVISATNASKIATSFNEVDGAGTYVRGYSVRTVTKAGNTVALALALSLCPCAAGDPNLLDSFVAGIEQASGTVPFREMIAGQRAAYFQNPDGINELIWAQGAEVVVLYGMNRASMEQLATALITANQ